MASEVFNSATVAANLAIAYDFKGLAILLGNSFVISPSEFVLVSETKGLSVNLFLDGITIPDPINNLFPTLPSFNIKSTNAIHSV